MGEVRSSRRVVVVCGVSGAGKSHLIRGLCEAGKGCVAVPSVTTRLPRRGEVDGVDKVFLDDAEFTRRLDGGDLVCAALNYGARYAHDAALIEGADGVPIIELEQASAGEFSSVFPAAVFVRVVPIDEGHALAAVDERPHDGTAVDARKADVLENDPAWATGVSWIEVVND